MSNTITAFFKGRAGVAESVYQYDYGKILIIDGLSLPATFEVHFTTISEDDAITVIGQNNRVAIPDSCISIPGTVTAYIYLHTGDNDGETEYVIKFAVIRRARPDYDEDDKSDWEKAASQALAMLQNSKKVNTPLDEYNQVDNGTAGQLLRTKGDGSTEWVDEGLPTDEQTAQAVSDWLDDHPEATTTVQDGSLTADKFTDNLKLYVMKDYITPQMYGAKADGIADDTDSIQACIDDAYERGIYRVFFPRGTYLITKPLVLYFSYDEFWHGKGITIEGEHQGNTIIIKQGEETYKDVDTVLYCTCGDAPSHNDGTGVSVFNFKLINQSEAVEAFCINGDNYARGEFKRLTVIGKYGIKCTGYSNLYDDIIGDTDETFFWDAGTSNLVGKIGCFGAHNPYILHAVYSTYDVLFGDNCTGIFVDAYPYGNCHINSIGTESPNLDCIVQAGRQTSTAQNKTITIDNIYCFNLIGEDAKYLVIKEARLKVDSIAILYQRAAVETTLCYFDSTYGTCQIGEIAPISNGGNYDASKFALVGNMGSRNHLFLNFAEYTGYIDDKNLLSLGGSTSFLGVLETNMKNKWQSIVMGGYFRHSAQYGEYFTADGTTCRYAVMPPKGSLILNDLTNENGNIGAAGFISIPSTDNEAYGNLIDNKAPIPIMYCTTEANVPSVALKNGTLLFDTSASKLKVYYDNAWVTIGS